MFNKNIRCTKCGRYYDTCLNACPECLTKNPSDRIKNIPSNILMLDVMKQLLLFLIGLIGLQFISTFWSTIYVEEIANILSLEPINILSNLGQYPIISFSVNKATYISLLIILTLLLIPLYRLVAQHLGKWKNYLKGIAFGFLLIVLNIALSIIVSSLNYGVSDNQKSLIEIISVNPITSLVILAIVGPICEELTYRLGLFSFLYRTGKRWVPYAVSTLIFALIHFNFASKDIVGELINLPSYIMAGIVLNMAYEKGGLPSSMVAHIMNNMLSISMIISTI